MKGLHLYVDDVVIQGVEPRRECKFFILAEGLKVEVFQHFMLRKAV